MRYVADIIGDSYKHWQQGDRILITNGTGSGKTFFVLNTLLRDAREQGKHLVYFCNRKFLSLQVQSAAQKLLLNELGEDAEELVAYLHIRTYQHSEKVYDYPGIKELDEDGKVKKYWNPRTCRKESGQEVTADEVLYYVFDEAFYMVADAGFNADTHYWFDKKIIWNNQKSISVFLAATPDPLYLFLQFGIPGRADLGELCKKYVAAHFINQDTYTDWWMRFYCPPYIRVVEAYEKTRFEELCYNYPEYYHSKVRQGQKEVDQLADSIVEMCRNPYKDLFAEVEVAYRNGSSYFNHVYRDGRSLQEQYDYLNTYYFDDMLALAKIIAASVRKNYDEGKNGEDRQRWLIFVRHREDGVTLQNLLRNEGCKSVAISARVTKNYDGSPCKRRGTVKKTLETLVHKQELDCDVLISTSVLDCGISLKAENVNNLVVCQPDKTSFLQMIGRIRVKEGQRVNLYVKSFTPSEVRGHRDDAEKMFLYLSKLYLKDEKIHRSSLGYGDQPNIVEGENFLVDGMVHILPKLTLQALHEELDNDRNRKKYMYDVKDSVRGAENGKESKLNALALVRYLGQFYFYKAQLAEYEDDPCYFLEEQLSWIGKSYDPENWIDYQSSRDAFHDYLKQAAKQEPMDKTAQLEFRRECFDYLMHLRMPPESVREAKRRHTIGSNKYPGKSKLNEIFIDLGLPFLIVSPQNKEPLIDKDTGEKIIDPRTGKPKVNNKSYWQIHNAVVEVMRPKLESKRESNRIKREERKAQKAKEAEQRAEQEKAFDSDNPLGVVVHNLPKKKTAKYQKSDTKDSKIEEQELPEKIKQTLKVQIIRGDEIVDLGE